MILDLYFARRFLRTFGGVFGAFFVITVFVGIVDQLRRYSGSEASFREILGLAALSTPQGIYRILPLVMIISSIALFLSLARSSEMVATRAAGRSAVRALQAPLVAALLLGCVAVGVLNPLVAATSKAFEARANLIAGERPILSLGDSGLWLRQGGIEGQTVIRAANANLGGTVLIDATFLRFGPEGQPLDRIDAARATLADGAWALEETKTWPLDPGATPEARATTAATLSLASTLTPDQIRNSFGTPSSIPIWDLPAFIDRLRLAGFSATRHAVWFQMEIALPLFLVGMVMVGAAFTLRHQRGQRTGLAVLQAVLLSFALYFLRNFAQIMGENGDVPVLLAAWVPPLVAIGLAAGLLLHGEEG